MTIVFSVIIPTCNRPEQLLALLRRLQEQRDGAPFEAIVVDDSSPNDLKLQVEAMASAQMPLAYLSSTQEGPGEARNLGASVARGEYLVFLDDDCVIGDDWLAALSHTVARSSADIYYGPIQSKLPPVAPFLHTVVMEDDPYRSTQAAFRKTLFHELGGFDPRLSHWSEGWDLVSRARRHGAQVQYLPNWFCWHTAHRVSPKYFQVGRFWQTLTRMQYLLTQHPESPDAYQHLASYCRLGFWHTMIRLAMAPFAFATLSPGRALIAFLLINLIYDALRLMRLQWRLRRWQILIEPREAVVYLALNWSMDLERALLRVALLAGRLRQMRGGLVASDEGWSSQAGQAG